LDETQAELEWEARAGRWAAAAAFLSTACVIGALGARTAIGKGSDKKAESLRIAHDHSSEILIFAVLTALSFAFLAGALLFLYRATKFRRPQLPVVAAYVAVLGPIILMVTGVLGTLDLLDKADQFVGLERSAQTEARAKDLVDSASPALAGLGYAGAISMGIALILISLNAMRAGLFSRFMGILGIIFGALQVLPLLPGPVIQIFWATALGLLFLGLWPGGRGPAWETGEAIEWPTQAQKLAESRGDVEDDYDEEPGAVVAADEAETEAEPAAQRSPNARSRKRKKRKAGR
jgi:membrane protein implicated in regulation of membrane protease activity